MGKKKASKAKAHTAQSAFAGVNEANVGLDGLVSASATKTGDGRNPGSIDVLAKLTGPARSIQDNALSGIGAAQRAGNLPAVDLNRQIQAGDNAFFNSVNEAASRAFNERLASLDSRSNLAGLQNSTVAGARQASLLDLQKQQDFNNILNSIQFIRNDAGNIIGNNINALTPLIAAQQNVAGLANNDLLTSLNDQSATSRFNAQQLNQVGMFNAQQANTMAAQPGIGSQLIGAAATLGGAALGGSFGFPQLGSITGGLANSLTGSGGGVPNSIGSFGSAVGPNQFGGFGVPNAAFGPASYTSTLPTVMGGY